MGLKEKAEKLKNRKRKNGNRANTSGANLPTLPSGDHETENTQSPSNFGTLAALIIGALGIILLKGRKT